MTHAELTDAVRASELLAASRTERHACYRNRVVPGGISTANLSNEGDPTRVHARQPEETRRAGWAAGSTQVCECSHLAGDHSDGRNRSLTPAPLGLCQVTGCSCREYRAAEGCGCPTVNGVLVEQASCPEHGWENHPVVRQIPGTTRHV